ncbi:MAG: 16S rRNA (uracil(1498)-N(3))-methyltransferase [Lentilitoribacter sp.]
MRANFRLQRLFIDQPLKQGVSINLEREQANYLLNVLRLKDDSQLLIFNGSDGEWLANLQQEGRKKAALILQERTRPQPSKSDLVILFAPIKVGRLEYMVQKMVEMGAGIIQPVFTDHTQLHKINDKRLSANIFEAAEQCGVLSIPEFKPAQKLSDLLAKWDTSRQIIYCDEGTQTNNPVTELNAQSADKFALLIGPEGGFSSQEREILRSLKHVTPIPLGPRILRADTALVAAMAVLQATIGDWE